MSSIDRICADPGKYSFDVDRLGECKIASPIRHHEFIEDGGRIMVTPNTELSRRLAEKLGVLFGNVTVAVVVVAEERFIPEIAFNVFLLPDKVLSVVRRLRIFFYKIIQVNRFIV